MCIQLKKISLIVILVFIGFGSLIIFYKYKNRDTPYSKYLAATKGIDPVKAYKILYPLVLEKDEKAMELIAESYTYAIGIDRDLVKANIWLERSKTRSFETGNEEFFQYKDFMQKHDFGMASIFLQKAAEKGNKDAIMTLKNDRFLMENKLVVDYRWKTYWKNFDYDNLYPFAKEMER